MTLHDELQQIADRAPAAYVPLDTWHRARRARARDRVVTCASALVVLVAVGLAWLPHHDEPPVADTDSLGVPDHLHVPEGLEPTSDLDVGVAAAAWQDYSRVVLVGADGSYHLLEPPGSEDLFMTDHTVALSPDGTQLAYAWADRDVDDAGLRIVDLTNGSVQAVRLGNRDDNAALQLTWSSNGRWVAWWGYHVAWQDDGSYSGSDRVAGRIRVGATRSQDVGPVPNDENLSLAVSPGGTVLLASTNGLVQARPAWRDRIPASFGRLSPASVVNPSSGELVVGVGGDGPSAQPPAGTVAVRVDPATGAQQRYPRGEDRRLMSSPLGFVDGDPLLAVSPMDAAGEHGDRRIELISADGRPRQVVEMDDLVPYGLTLATDLMSPERLTVDRPEPDWPSPWWNDRLLLVLLGGATLTLAALLALTRLARRPR